METTEKGTEIEALKTKVSDLSKELEKLQNDTISNSEKKEKAVSITSKAEDTEQKIQSKIDDLSLTDGQDEESEKLKKDLEDLLREVRETKEKSQSLCQSAQNLDDPDLDSQQEENQGKEEKEEKKGFFTKIGEWFSERTSNLKNWFSDRVDDFQSRDKFNEHPAENWGLVLSVVGGLGILCYRWKKKRDKRKEEEELNRKRESSEGGGKKVESESLWKKFGKILKGALIGGLSAFGIYQIFQYIRSFGIGDSADIRSSNKDKYNDYKKEIVDNPENKEKFENYESFGENIDVLYKSIYDRELRSGYDDELEMQKIAVEQSSKEQEVTVTVKIGDKVKEIPLGVTIKNGKMDVKAKEEIDDTDELFKDIKVKEGEQEIPDGEIKVEDLIEFPDGTTVEFKDGIGVNKENNTEEHYRGIIPYCLDNHFKSVENILGQNSSMQEAIANKLDGMIDYIKGKGQDFLQLFVSSYLDKLPSWAPFKNVTGSLIDKIDQWKLKNENAEMEMKYFFRQSIRIQTYLFEKRDQLAKKIAEESSTKYGISVDDILSDDDNLKKYVIDTPEYQNFNNNPIHSAVIVLKKYNIFDGNITEGMKDRVEEIDDERNDVLSCEKGEKDILEIINEKKESGEELTEQENKLLEKACDGIIEDIDNNILEAVEESAFNIFSDVAGLDDALIREYLEKSGLEKVFLRYKKEISDAKTYLKKDELNIKGKIALAESINAMLALKKEAELGKRTLEKDHDENGNIIYRIGGFLIGSLKNVFTGVEKLTQREFLEGTEYLLSGLFGTGLLISSLGIFTWNGKLVKRGIKIAASPIKLAAIPARITFEGITMVKPVRDGIERINYPFKFIGEEGPEKLMDLLKDGKITLAKASETAKRKTFRTILSGETERRWKKFYNITNNDGKDKVIYKVFDKLITEHSIGPTYLQDIKNADGDLYETLVRNYDTSPEIRQAISGDSSISELKKVAEQSRIPESVRNNPHYKKINDDLNLYEDQTRLGRERSELSIPEKKQLDNIREFRKTISKMNEKELERTAELLGEFKGSGTLGDAIKHFNTISKLEGKILDTGVLDNSGNPIKKNLDDIIKNMDFNELRNYKRAIEGVSGVSDDAIESLARTFESIQKSKVLKFSKNIDEIAKLVKTFVKFLAKVT